MVFRSNIFFVRVDQFVMGMITAIISCTEAFMRMETEPSVNFIIVFPLHVNAVQEQPYHILRTSVLLRV